MRYALLALLFSACGSDATESETLDFQISVHPQVNCPGVTPLLAKLDVAGLGVCLLEVKADKTVGGACYTPAGAIRDFRLVYYTGVRVSENEVDAATLQEFCAQDVDPGFWTCEVQLASVVARLDLRNERREKVQLEFPAERLDVSTDDDSDGVRNLEEYCAGTNPLAQGS